jgi:Tol biopolymer transport system component
LTALVSCSGSGTSSSGEGVIVNGEVPLAYVKRSTSVRLNPVTSAGTAPGGDLMLREASSPSATEHNLTARFTQGVGDASDPEVSYDGKRIVFSMRCPASNTATVDGTATGEKACTGRWNLWEYTVGGTGAALARGSFKRLTASTEHDDVDPVYLPANRGIVFSSNRQAKSHLNQALGRSYFAADEYEREPC